MDTHSYQEALTGFENYLRLEERSENTVMKYLRDVKAFLLFLADRKLEKDLVLEWKEGLSHTYAAASVNSMLASVNSFFTWTGHPEWKVRPLKIQRKLFSEPEKELNYEEYVRLVKTAGQSGNERLSLLIQTICSTGIRVSELPFITVSAVNTGWAVVDCKGKRRTVFLPPELRRLLKRYLRKQGQTSGPVFVTKNNKPLHRSNIWREMKALCKSAGVAPDKVFPHNLRHLFARTYYSLEKDLSRLADLLGHVNINTTRVYTIESGDIHARQIGKMRLVVT